MIRVSQIASMLLLPFLFLVAAESQPGLKDAYKGSFLIGVALNRAQIYGENVRGVALIKQNFDAISPENVLKWESIHPQLHTYDFTAADRYVEFGEANHMFIVGHTLVWHNQTPAWVFEDGKGKALTRDKLLRRMRDHIHKVVGRYKGRINGWDVVNEALNEDGTLRQSKWMQIIGEDYIAKAFQYAHEADPKAELYYNEYNLEKPEKRRGAIELIKKLKAQGIPVKAVGLQGHYRLEWPTLGDLDATITEIAAQGVKVNITELDINVLPQATAGATAEVTAKAEARPDLNPYASGLPDSIQEQLTQRYAGLFGVFLKHRDVISRVTFWGLADGDSWLNNWPLKGRTNYPLLFDREGKPKPAYEVIMKLGLAQTRQP
jgi:endo-1,4-beta-xylanase